MKYSNIFKNKFFNIKSLWWLGLFLLLAFFHCKHDFDSDDGVALEGAWNLINNRGLYTDFFEFITPGSFYLIFWAWKIFGVNYFIAKALAVLFIFFSSIGIYKICWLTTKDKLCYFMPAIFIISSVYWPIINHNTFNLFFIIWAIYFFIKGLSDYSFKNFIISGLLTGMAILFLQHKGIIVLLALSLFLFILFIKEKKALLLKLNFCYLSFSMLPLIILFIKWPIQSLYENLIIFPLFHYTEVNKVPFYLFIFFTGLILLTAWHLRKEKSNAVRLLVFAQLFLLLTVLQRPDIFHISYIIFPLYCLFPLFYEKTILLNKSAQRLNYLIIFLALFLIIIPVFYYLISFTPFYSIKNSQIILFIKENCPGQYIYAGPFRPEIYFEVRKLNPTPYFTLVTNHQTKEQFLEAEKYLEKHQPSCAVMDYEMVKKFHHNKNNPVDNYITDNYQLVFQSGNKLIYKKK